VLLDERRYGDTCIRRFVLRGAGDAPGGSGEA